MIIGTMFLGKVKEVNKQWIETKFLIFGIPLFPMSSMLVTASSHNLRKGINIPINNTSVIAGYARLLTFVAALILIIMGSADVNKGVLLTGLVLAALWLYFYFKFGKATPAEIAERSKLGNSIGLYALPNWFDFDAALNNYKNLEFHYNDKFQNSKWKDDLAEPHVAPEKRPVLYALALFNYMVDQTSENEKLLNKADSIYFSHTK